MVALGAELRRQLPPWQRRARMMQAMQVHVEDQQAERRRQPQVAREFRPVDRRGEVIDIVEHRDHHATRDQKAHQHRPIGAEHDRRSADQRPGEQRVGADHAQPLRIEELPARRGADRGERRIIAAIHPVDDAADRRARQAASQRRGDFRKIQSKYQRSKEAETRLHPRRHRGIVDVRPIDRIAIVLMVRQVAEAQHVERRAEQHRHQAPGLQVALPVLMKAAMDRLVMQRPEEIREQRDRRQQPAPARVERQQPQR